MWYNVPQWLVPLSNPFAMVFPMTTVTLNMFLTTALAVVVLYIGAALKKRFRVLQTFCIPAPVIGGLLFSLVSCILHVAGVLEFAMDETLKNVCMVMFFTSVGFQANLKVLRSGGLSLLLFLGCVCVLIALQNLVAVGLSGVLDVSPLVGMSTGSIAMTGGHGTAGAFGPLLEKHGLEGGTTLCTAAATFGLVAGSLMGGPVGRRLIKVHGLKPREEDAEVLSEESILIEDEEKHRRSVKGYAPAAYQLVIAMGLGTIVTYGIEQAGMSVPVYIGPMLVAAVMRNVGELSGKFKIYMGEINDVGGICLGIFLGIAMIGLKLWQLADLALPLMILLAAQTVLMFAFAYFAIYNLMGRDYDSAVLTSGACGFGMGATPNAMANMQAVTERYGASVKAFLLVPIVGSMFADFVNSLIISLFLNIV